MHVDDIADVLETWKVADVIETLEKSSKKSEISSSQLLEVRELLEFVFVDLVDFPVSLYIYIYIYIYIYTYIL